MDNYPCFFLKLPMYSFDFFCFIFRQVFGFLNLILWGGNCWFIYKETPFHKSANPPANVEGWPKPF